MKPEFLYKLQRAKDKLDGLYSLCITEQVTEGHALDCLEDVVASLDSAKHTLRNEEEVHGP